MEAPQIVWIVLIAISLFESMQHHGEYEEKNFWHKLISCTIGTLILWWGGFWG